MSYPADADILDVHHRLQGGQSFSMATAHLHDPALASEDAALLSSFAWLGDEAGLNPFPLLLMFEQALGAPLLPRESIQIGVAALARTTGCTSSKAADIATAWFDRFQRGCPT